MPDLNPTASLTPESTPPNGNPNRPIDAFLLYNSKESVVRSINFDLIERGIRTYFSETDLPYGSELESFENERLNEAGVILVFLGNSGWGQSHLRLAKLARAADLNIIPVLIGTPQDNTAFSEARGLFQTLVYLDLREITRERLDTLADSIRKKLPAAAPSASPEPPSKNEPQLEPQPQPQSDAADGGVEEDPRMVPELDRIIRVLEGGNQKERVDILNVIDRLRPGDKASLAVRIRAIIDKHSGPPTLEEATAEPASIAETRSWMLSGLIWSDMESGQSRAIILFHIQPIVEPERTVRFWALAGLYQRHASYLQEAVSYALYDSAAPEVMALAKAIDGAGNPQVIELLQSQLQSTDFFTGPWPVLRMLRVVAVPQLAAHVCAILGRSVAGSNEAYDSLYALTLPEMAPEAAKILAMEPGIDWVVDRVILDARRPDDNATRNYIILLAEFEATEIDLRLDAARRDPKKTEPASRLWSLLQDYRALIASGSFQETYSVGISDSTAYSKREPGKPLDDALKVGKYAGHLAQLIAAKETAMPLSIGLFGAWGSGKSHFIDLIGERLGDFKDHGGSAFYKRIVQIKFNAWHYLDSNLWANLVSEIFDQLFARLDESKETSDDQLNKLKSELAKQSAIIGDAKEALESAEKTRKLAEETLRAAMEARIVEEKKVGALLNDVKALVLGDNELKADLHSAATGLGFDKVETSFEELEMRAQEVRSLGGRTKALMLAIFASPFWRWNTILLAVALGLPLLLAWLAKWGPVEFQQILAGATRSFAQLVSVVGALTAWISVKTREGNSVIGNLERAYDKVKKSRSAKESTDAAAEAQSALAEKRREEEAARCTLNDAEEKMKSIRTELAQLAPGRQLIRFLKDRASADDYRRHLGLVSIVRKDFERLSTLLLTATQENDASMPQIDRIVLYIDDLDRCRADKVIQVLEAVHLLLAFPLFAVIVAVDPRWLRQSLIDEFPGLLIGGETTTGNGTAAHSPAKPQDYLEKIFQVPFNLQPMRKEGFDTLVAELFCKAKPPGVPPPALPATVQNEGAGKLPAPADSALKTQAPAGETPAPGAGTSQPDPPKKSPGAQLNPGDVPKTTPAGAPPDPQRLAFTTKEITDVQSLQPLFETPRAVKRFANTYSLIRVGVEKRDWDGYLGPGQTPGDYRVPLLLLAVAAAFPSLAHSWLTWLEDTPPSAWLLDKKTAESLAETYRDCTEKADWLRLSKSLSDIDLYGWPGPGQPSLKTWLKQVARYSF